MVDECELFRELVIGYIVTEIKGENGKNVYTKPIVTGNDVEYGMNATDDCNNELCSDERVVGVIPAPFPTYCIQAVDEESGQIFILGYEHPTLTPTDWNAAYDRAMKNKAYYGILKS